MPALDQVSPLAGVGAAREPEVGDDQIPALRRQLLADGLGFWHAARRQDLAAAEARHLWQRSPHAPQVVGG